MKTATVRLSAQSRRAVECPTCNAQCGAPCKGSRIPGANTLGGGWGGPPSLQREHAARIADAREYQADIANEPWSVLER